MNLEGRKFGHIAGSKDASGAPSDPQLAQINTRTLRPHKAEEVYTRTFNLAHNAMDRDGECFDGALLKDFATSLPGKGLFVRHPMSWDGDSGPGVGRWYGAEVQTMTFAAARDLLKEPDLQWPPDATDAQVLVASAYMPRTPGNSELIAGMDAGTVGDCSIGFQAAGRSEVQDAEHNVMGYRLMGPGEALEGSLVWLGAQPGARAVKQLRRATDQPSEDETMDIKELQVKLDEANKRLAAVEVNAKGFEAVIAAIGGELAANPARLKMLVGEAETLRNDLVEDIVRLERLSKLLPGDTEQHIKDAKAVHLAADLPRLKGYLARLKALQPAGATIAGSDPAASGRDPKDEKIKPGAKGAGVLDNPLLAGDAAAKATA